MLILKEAYIKKNLRFFLFLKIITIIILIWIYHPYDDVFTYGRSIENKYKGDSTFNIILKRFMSENEEQNKIDKTCLYKNFPYNYDNKRSNIHTDDKSIYGNMKNKDSKKLKLYKTAYKHRYAKKKGLSKLDCYCEKGLFDKIDYIYKIAENCHNNVKFNKRKLLNKYIFPFFLFGLLPLLGLIMPLLFNENFAISKLRGSNHDPSSCSKSSTHHCDQFTEALITESAWETLVIFNKILLFTLIIIVLIVNTYNLIKFIKYEKLKAGKSKMSVKEYCRFCKDVFM